MLKTSLKNPPILRIDDDIIIKLLYALDEKDTLFGAYLYSYINLFNTAIVILSLDLKQRKLYVGGKV